MDPKRPSLLKRTLRILLWLGGSLLVLALAGLFVFDRVLQSKYEPALAALRENVTKNVDFFCEQQVILAEDPWFHEPRTEGDAGPLLSHWVGWEGRTSVPKDSPLAIPAFLPQKVGDFNDWLTSTVDVSLLDFSWMEKLHAYDRWDLLKSSPVEPQQQFNMATLSVPNLLPLQLWARFRLLHGLRIGEPLPAARDVRHLAWLAYRTDSLLGGMIGAMLLKSELQAYQSLQAPPPEWHPMSAEQIERLRALMMSGMVFSNIAAPAEVARKARSCGAPVVTRCMALAEAGFLSKYLKPLAQDLYAAQYTALEEDLASAPCPTSLARTVWEQGVTVENWDSEAVVPGQLQWMQRLPRKYVGPTSRGSSPPLATPASSGSTASARRSPRVNSRPSADLRSPPTGPSGRRACRAR
jgi:hypothetical protein